MLETVQDALDAYFPDARVELRSTTELKQWLRAHLEEFPDFLAEIDAANVEAL